MGITRLFLLGLCCCLIGMMSCCDRPVGGDIESKASPEEAFERHVRLVFHEGRVPVDMRRKHRTHVVFAIWSDGYCVVAPMRTDADAPPRYHRIEPSRADDLIRAVRRMAMSEQHALIVARSVPPSSSFFVLEFQGLSVEFQGLSLERINFNDLHFQFDSCLSCGLEVLLADSLAEITPTDTEATREIVIERLRSTMRLGTRPWNLGETQE